MDEFCDAHNTTAEIIFEEIDSIKHDPFVSEFLPQVLLNIEYDHFIKQMKEAADEAFNREEAESCAQVEFLPGSKVNISGTYRAHSSYKYDEDNFNSYLQAVGAPWVLRKLIIKTTRNIDDVFVVQDESSMAFKFKMKVRNGPASSPEPSQSPLRPQICTDLKFPPLCSRMCVCVCRPQHCLTFSFSSSAPARPPTISTSPSSRRTSGVSRPSRSPLSTGRA